MSALPEQHSPFGTKHQCAEANRQLMVIIEAAKEACRSDDSPVKRRQGYEHRKHPNLAMWYSIEEDFRGEEPLYSFDNYRSSYTVRISVIDDHDNMSTFVVYTCPCEFATDHRKYLQALNVSMAANEDVDRFDKVSGEGYTTFRGGRHLSSDFRHECFDGSVKHLRVIPDPALRGGRPISEKRVIVRLSESNQLFKAERSWALFLATEASHERVAFKALEDLDTCTDKALLKSISRVGQTFHRFVPDSKSERYFRKNSDGDFEEYRLHPAAGELHLLTFSRPPTQVQASLGLRKARIYGEEIDGHRSEDDRF